MGVRMKSDVSSTEDVVYMELELRKDALLSAKLCLRVNLNDLSQVCATVDVLEELPKLVRTLRGLYFGRED